MLLSNRVEDPTLVAMAKDSKKYEPRTDFSRTDPLETKNRNAGDQGHNFANGVLKKRRSSKKKVHRAGTSNFLRTFMRFQKKKKGKNVIELETEVKVKFSLVIFLLTIKKIVLSWSRGHGIFEDLYASRPKPRT